MSKTVFILGAGASAAAGAPVMADFIDTAERILLAGEARQYTQSFELVFRAIARLQAVYAKAFIDTCNLESVFGAFEMAELLGRPSDLKQDGPRDLVVALKELIVHTLESRIEYPINNSTTFAPWPYRHLAMYLQKEHGQTPGSVSVVTFNYDYALDYALAGTADYCLTPATSTDRIPLMKLHGSLNWARCGGNEIETWHFDRPAQNLIEDTRQATRLRIADKFRKELTRTRPSGEFEACIVPPTWNKKGHYEQLAEVWRHAARHLSEAEHIVIAGYSLPPTDEFFRYLFALGTIGDARLKSLWVFDKFPSKQLDERYRKLLGPLAQSRYALVQEDFANVAGALAAGGWAQLDERVRKRSQTA